MLNITSEDCLRCKPGMNCTESGMFLETIQTTPGYWREQNQSDDFYACNEEENCVGGSLSEQCEENKFGVLCGVCLDQHVRVGSDCIACPPGQGRGGSPMGGIVVVGLTPCIVLFVVLIYYFGRREKKEKNEKETKNATTKVTPVLNDSKDATSTLEANYQNAKANEEDGGKKEEGDGGGGSTESWLQDVNEAVQEVINEEAKTQTITQSLKNNVEDQAKSAVEDEVADATALASGDTTDESIGGGDDEVSQEMSMEDGTAIMLKAEDVIADAESRVSGRLRILIGFVQIMAGLSSGFTIPWPPMFLSIINFVTIINFDFAALFGGLDACSLYSPFLSSAAFHMAILPLFAMMVIAAAIVARFCLRNKASVVSKRAQVVMLELMMFLYRELLLSFGSLFLMFCVCIRYKLFLVSFWLLFGSFWFV